jgi:hypothetical protein
MAERLSEEQRRVLVVTSYGVRTVDEIDVLLDELRALRQQTAWQGMETAPKDGTYILLWWPHWCPQYPIIGRWFYGDWDSRWRNSDHGPSPKGWMPLPPAPQPEQKD